MVGGASVAEELRQLAGGKVGDSFRVRQRDVEIDVIWSHGSSSA